MLLCTLSDDDDADDDDVKTASTLDVMGYGIQFTVLVLEESP